jgi:hypothetical protein
MFSAPYTGYVQTSELSLIRVIFSSAETVQTSVMSTGPVEFVHDTEQDHGHP